jgi:hypothetical protein
MISGLFKDESYTKITVLYFYFGFEGREWQISSLHAPPFSQQFKVKLVVISIPSIVIYYKLKLKETLHEKLTESAENRIIDGPTSFYGNWFSD